MTSQRAKRKIKSRRSKTVVIFGESENDTFALREFFRALRPDFEGAIRPLKDPPILIKDARPDNLPDRASVMASIIEAENLTADVVGVLAHEDCDNVEPAHVALSEKIERLLWTQGISADAVTPAWEMEAWLFLWPDAVKTYKPKWRKPDKYNGSNVGMLSDAKEKFIRAVRPVGSAKSGVRDYSETDAPMIAAKVRELGIINSLSARSQSYERFRDAVLNRDLTQNVFEEK